MILLFFPRMIKWITKIFCMMFILTACSKNNTTPQIKIFNFSPSSGAPDNTVTITGSGFGVSANAATVYFNGVTARPDSLTDSVIVVKVPTGATTGKISLNINGQHSTSTHDFIILPGVWIRMADLPIPGGRGLGTGFSIAGKGYFGFGYDGGTYYNDLYQYDTATNAWTQMASSPGPTLESPVCMVIGNMAYIGIGKTLNAISSGSSGQLWQYDPQNNIWTRKADLPDTLQEGAFGVGVGSMGYAGLSEGTLGTKGWWQYNPANDAWARKADYPGLEMQQGTGFAVNGKIYSGLGNVSGPGGNNQWWQYDTATDTWTAKNSFPGNIPYFGAAFTLSGKGYVAGGNECWQYDDANDTWTQMAFFDNRIGGSAFAIGNKAFYIAGRHEPPPDNLLQKDLWEFDPAK
jgi:hypothetical protein